MEDINEVIVSGVINNIRDSNNQYVKFGLTTIKNNKKIFISLNINKNLYETYKDFFNRENKVFIKGYLNSYQINNKIESFITVINISNNYEDIINNKIVPHIRYDKDNVMIWNGKRCEVKPLTKQEQEELDKLLSVFK